MLRPIRSISSRRVASDNSGGLPSDSPAPTTLSFPLDWCWLQPDTPTILLGADNGANVRPVRFPVVALYPITRFDLFNRDGSVSGQNRRPRYEAITGFDDNRRR